MPYSDANAPLVYIITPQVYTVHTRRTTQQSSFSFRKAILLFSLSNKCFLFHLNYHTNGTTTVFPSMTFCPQHVHKLPLFVLQPRSQALPEHEYLSRGEPGIFLRKHNKIGPKQKSNILRVVRPTTVCFNNGCV